MLILQPFSNAKAKLIYYMLNKYITNLQSGNFIETI